MLGVKGNDGNIPLTIAIAATMKVHDTWQLRWSDEMIESLVAQTHAANAESIPSCRSVFKKTEGRNYGHYEGESVLHIAQRTRRPLSVIRCIVDVDVDALLSTHKGYSYSSVTSEYYDEDFHGARRNHRVTSLLPFHRALWHGAHIDILKYLAERHPTSDLFEWTDTFQNTALHMAIRKQRRGERAENRELLAHRKESPLPVATVRYLIHAGEMALLIPDEHGNTPLHLAIAGGSNIEIVQLLIQTCTPPVSTHRHGVLMREMPCESVFSMQNTDQRTPLHLAVMYAKSTAMLHTESTAPLHLILQSCARAMLIKDKDGCTPMHLMMSACCFYIVPDTVLQLLQVVPVVLLVQDNLGRTPLHTLLKNMAACNYKTLPRDWQQTITRHLTGVTSGLLTRDQTQSLMRLVDGAQLTPLQYYQANIGSRDDPFYFGVAGRELERAHACS